MMIAKYQRYHRGLATFNHRSAVRTVIVRLTYGTVLHSGVAGKSRIISGVRLNQAWKVRGLYEYDFFYNL